MPQTTLRHQSARATLFCASLYLGALAGQAQAQADCTDWNTIRFFEVSTASDVKRCIDAGAKINEPSKAGYTPLHLAAGFGNSEAVKELLRSGADIEAQANNGDTPLLLAERRGNVETTSVLLSAGANPKSRKQNSCKKNWRGARVCTKGPKNWNVQTRISQIDDSTNVYLRKDSRNTVRGHFSSGTKVKMRINCRENTTSIYFDFGDHHYMTDFQYGTITYRIDKQKAGKKRMRESTDNSSLGLWRGSSSIPFIKQLFGHNKLLIIATPYGESPVQVTFDISGLEEAINPLREACNW